MPEDRNDKMELTFDRIVRWTDSAILVEVDNQEHWLPKSQVNEGADFDVEQPIVIPRWLAEDRGLEAYCEEV